MASSALPADPGVPELDPGTSPLPPIAPTVADVDGADLSPGLRVRLAGEEERKETVRELLTTLTTVLALLPLAVGTGEAAALRSPMAVTIIGGIVASTLGSLLVLPCLYLVIERLRPGSP